MAKRTYRYFDGEPLFAFGHGLSYSTFAYSGVRVSKAGSPPAEPLQVSAAGAVSRRRGGREGRSALPRLLRPGAPRRALRDYATCS
ncbi:MAG: hypothetical protein U0599_21755 [Vicinamibacteria bacterium]